jgi:hypothetical protein
MKFRWLLILWFLLCSSTYAQIYDIEPVGFTKPMVKKATSGLFSDAKYYMMGETGEIGVLLRNNGEIAAIDCRIDFEVFIEDSTGMFNTLVYSTFKTVNIGVGNTTEIILYIGEGLKPFMPISYDEATVAYPGLKIPEHYKTMTKNTTPRYVIIVSTGNDDNNENNIISEVFRFYIKKEYILLSVESSFADIENETNPDILAGRLNSDYICNGFSKLGLGFSAGKDVKGDIFDRKSWEPAAVDYTQYDMLFWSDGHDKPLTKPEMEDLVNFKKSSDEEYKKCLFICSQEMFRENYANDSNWVKEILNARKYDIYPNNPNNGQEYSTEDNPDRYIVGSTISRYLKFEIKRTAKYPTDPGPIPGLLSLYTDGNGLTRSAYEYNPVSILCPEPMEKSAGTATISITLNSVYLAVDWRHIANDSTLLLGLFEFWSKNNGMFYNAYVSPDSIIAFPGDEIIYGIRTVNATLLDDPASMTLKVFNCFTESYDTITTTDSGIIGYTAKYPVNIPDIIDSGVYKIRFSPLHSNGNPYFPKIQVITIPDSTIVKGNFVVCRNDTVSYKLFGQEKTNLWEIEGNGEIIGDSTATTIKIFWPEPGEYSIILHQTDLISGVSKEYRYNVSVKPSPEKPLISQKGKTLYSSSEKGNTWFVDSQELGGSSNHLVPKKSGKYTVRVTGENGCNSEMSDAINFVLDVEEDNTISDFSIIPNPANNNSVINYTLHTPGFVILKIYNTMGEEMYVLVNEYLVAGKHSIPLGQELIPGAYYIKFQCNEKIQTGKILVIK